MTAARPRKKTGFSLIEAAIVLAIVGLVIGGIWVAASAVATKMKISRTLVGLTFAVSQGQKKLPMSMYTGSYVWIQGSGATMGITMNIFPKDWVSGTRVV